MNKQSEKPTAEAKALSLFLMAFKATKPAIKEQAKRMNKNWDRVKSGDLSKEDYDVKVESVLKAHGGYEKVMKDTVYFYIRKTGEWTLKGDDKYCQDAQVIADKILKKGE
jgi:hypothetical protein